MLARPQARRSRHGSLRATALGGALLLLGTAGCGTRHLARTVGEGHTELQVHAGGPFFSDVGVAVPILAPRIGVRHGVTDWMDVMVSLDPAPIVFGLGVLDAGSVFQLYRDAGGFALSASARLHLAVDFDDRFDTRAFPELGLHAEHFVAERVILFGGAAALFQFTPPQGKPAYFIAPYLGAEVLLKPSKKDARQVGLTAQISWISPWEDSTSVVTWEPEGHGAIVLHLGARWRFGGLDR